jgi:hypothetical protein
VSLSETLYVEGYRAGDVSLNLSYNNVAWHDYVVFHVIDIEYPYDSDRDGLIDDSGNEFTFTSDNPGILSFRISDLFRISILEFRILFLL